VIDQDIEALAAHVATEAVKTGKGAPRFGDKVDALKTLAAYYAILMKSRGKKVEPDDTPTFEDFAAQVHGADNGRAQVRGGRGE
jgi:hypothetical protein